MNREKLERKGRAAREQPQSLEVIDLAVRLDALDGYERKNWSENGITYLIPLPYATKPCTQRR
ncbi:protein of unknown function [Candidatus Nitrospira inopinata]|uniref:Uncharacterized protein n=1 Tax=Candidatus Nitrospira inopinata TaxID=1715989 RepID=A0A0S4KM57_9BACT|nr:protein of unknown function [Candidatus Nitrospira inopinata]